MALAGLVTGFALLAWRRNDLFYSSLFLALLFPLLVWATGFIATPIFMERTVLVAQIGGAFLIGAVVAFMPSTPIAAGIFIVSFIPYTISAGGYLGRNGQEASYGAHLVQDWKGLMRAVSGRSKPDAIVLCDDFSYPTIRYYAYEPDIFVLRSGQPVSLNDPAWLNLYGLPVADRLASGDAYLDKLSKDGRVKMPSWDEIRRRYKTVWTARPKIYCASDFEELISRELSGQGFSRALDISQNGIVAKLFVRNN